MPSFPSSAWNLLSGCQLRRSMVGHGRSVHRMQAKSMKLLGITDLHNSRSALVRILAEAGQVDVVLLGGDLTNFGSPPQAQALVEGARASCPTVLAVAGNCDSAEIDRRLVELGVSLHGRGVAHQGTGLHGLSAMPPWMGGMYELSEAELADRLESGYAQIEGAERHVVLSHPPPRGATVDRTSRGENVGSTALRTFIDRTQPLLVLCGHIHEARGMEKIGRSTVVNCGPAAAGYYAVAELGDELQIELRQV